MYTSFNTIVLTRKHDPELPENAPRFVVLTYEHKFKDGRVNYPLILIDWVPAGAETGSLTLHAGAFMEFQNVVSNATILMNHLSSLTHFFPPLRPMSARCEKRVTWNYRLPHPFAR